MKVTMMSIIILGAIESMAQVTINEKNDYCEITDSSIAGIRIGEKVEQIQIDSTFKLERTSDGDGVALISVLKNGVEVVQIWAGEDNTEQPIEINKNVLSLQTFNNSCKMKNGLHPGSKISDVEKIYGKKLEIEISEIESRENIKLNNNGCKINIRVDGAGKYNKNAHKTKDYNNKKEILSISI